LRRPLAQLLIESLRTSPGRFDPQWQSISADDLVNAADHHRIAPAVYNYVRAMPQTPPDWLAPLKSRHDQQLIRHLTTSADLDFVARTLDHAGLDWLVMKGPVLSDVLWPRPDMRQYYDLDVLVDRPQFAAAVQALEAAGAGLLDRNWPLIRQQMHAELSMILPNGTPLDLHWGLVTQERKRFQTRVPAAQMLQRRTMVDIGGQARPTFDPADTVLSLAVHAAHAGATRLMWLNDIACALARDGVEWSTVRTRARDARLELPVQIVLAKTRRVLGVAVPSVGRDRAWSFAARLADRVRPAPVLPGDRGSGQLVYCSVRSSSLTSAAVALNSLIRRPVGSSAQPNPIYLDVPDDESRSAYFDRVEHAMAP